MAEDPTGQRRATYADILASPEHMVAEIVGGELYNTPRPAARHARASSRLGMAIGGPFDIGRDGPGGWVILDEPELHLGADRDILVPDLAGWRRERLPEIPSEAGIAIVPDWVCEVLSPSTERLDRTAKMPVYARENVQYLWLIHPLAETLEIFRLELGRWVPLGTHRGKAIVNPEPFEALPLDLASIWAS